MQKEESNLPRYKGDNASHRTILFRDEKGGAMRELSGDLKGDQTCHKNVQHAVLV